MFCLLTTLIFALGTFCTYHTLTQVSRPILKQIVNLKVPGYLKSVVKAANSSSLFHPDVKTENSSSPEPSENSTTLDLSENPSSPKPSEKLNKTTEASQVLRENKPKNWRHHPRFRTTRSQIFYSSKASTSSSTASSILSVQLITSETVTLKPPIPTEVSQFLRTSTQENQPANFPILDFSSVSKEVSLALSSFTSKPLTYDEDYI